MRAQGDHQADRRRSQPNPVEGANENYGRQARRKCDQPSAFCPQQNRSVFGFTSRGTRGRFVGISGARHCCPRWLCSIQAKTSCSYQHSLRLCGILKGGGMRCRYCAFETKVRMVAGVLPIRSASCSMNMTRGDPPSVAGREFTFSSHTRARARVGCRSPRARTLFGRLAEYRGSDQCGFARYPPYSLTPDALCWVISSLTWPSGSSVIMASDVRSPSRIVWSNLERATNLVNNLLKTMTYVHMYVRKYVSQ